ncbi:MAG: FixH family protein [Saprospiraceae bacterium]
MKIKWNWGTGIALTYTVFVIAIMGFVISSSSKQIDLVSADYYDKEIAFQGQIEKLSATKNLNSALEWKLLGDSIFLNFPVEIESEISGEVRFFCPANAKNDRASKIGTAGTNEQVIDVAELNPGRFQMQIDWESDGVRYYEEHSILIAGN